MPDNSRATKGGQLVRQRHGIEPALPAGAGEGSVIACRLDRRSQGKGGTMRKTLHAVLLLWTSAALAGPIAEGLTVNDFFASLEQAAIELAEGGMDLNRLRCSPDGTLCQAYYGAGNSVVGTAPAKAPGREATAMETIVVTMEIAGETEDFWLTSSLVMDVLEPDFLTEPERADLVLRAMRNPGPSEVAGRVARYLFDRVDGKFRMRVVAR